MKTFVTFLLICLSPLVASTQENTAEPSNYTDKVNSLEQTLNTLYTVISGEKGATRDWKLFKYLFTPNAKLIPSRKDKNGHYKVAYMSPDDYIKHSKSWFTNNSFFEKEIHRKVDTFGNITHVFSTYEAFNSNSDNKPFMRGINSIQLLNDGKRWWIVNIYWTQETKETFIPRKYLPKEQNQ